MNEHMEEQVAKVLLVKMAELAVVENSRLLKTTLGSCVGVVLHDAKRSIGGLAHIILPERLKMDASVGKYADTAIPALLSRMLKRGSRKENIRAYLSGGANMFKLSDDRKIATVGEKNIEATKRILAELQIPVTFEDTGGEEGRTIIFDNHRGEIQIKTLSKVVWKGDKN